MQIEINIFRTILHVLIVKRKNKTIRGARWSYFYITLQNDYNYSLIAVTTPEPTV